MKRCNFFLIYSSNSRNIWFWAELKERSHEMIIIFSITNSESDATKNEEKLAWDREEKELKQSDEETELTRLNLRSNIISTWEEFKRDREVLESDEKRAKLTEMSIKSLSSALKSIN